MIRFEVVADESNISRVREFTKITEMRRYVLANACSNFEVSVWDDEDNLITLPSKCYWKNGIIGAHPTYNELINA